MPASQYAAVFQDGSSARSGAVLAQWRHWCWSFVSHAALLALFCLMVASCAIVDLGDPKQVRESVAIAAVLWVIAHAVPLALDRELARTWRGWIALGIARDKDLSRASNNPGMEEGGSVRSVLRASEPLTPVREGTVDVVRRDLPPLRQGSTPTLPPLRERAVSEELALPRGVDGLLCTPPTQAAGIRPSSSMVELTSGVDLDGMPVDPVLARRRSWTRRSLDSWPTPVDEGSDLVGGVATRLAPLSRGARRDADRRAYGGEGDDLEEGEESASSGRRRFSGGGGAGVKKRRDLDPSPFHRPNGRAPVRLRRQNSSGWSLSGRGWSSRSVGVSSAGSSRGGAGGGPQLSPHDEFRHWAKSAARHPSASLLHPTSARQFAHALHDEGGLALSAVREALDHAYEAPAYWTIRCLRSCVWCGNYIIGTYWLLSRDPATGHWELSNMPELVLVLVRVSIFTTLLDYAYEMSVGGGWSFVFSFGSLAMFVATPLFFLAVSALSEAVNGGKDEDGGLAGAADLRPRFFLVQYGWVRFLELYRDNTVLLRRAGVTSVEVVTVSLAIGMVCIILTVAGSVHSFEAPTEDESFQRFEHFVWFAVTTLTTVGYGDFAPSLTVSRTACMAGMVLAISWVPLQVTRLQHALAQQPVHAGRMPERGEPFVLLCGRVSRLQVRAFFRQVARHRISWPARFVVLSVAPLEDLEIHRLPREIQARAYFEQADILASKNLGTPAHRLNLRTATAVFVFNREKGPRALHGGLASEDQSTGAGGVLMGAEVQAMRPLALGAHNPSVADNLQAGEADRQTAMRVLTLLNFVRPANIAVQLQSLHHAPMLRTHGVQHMVCFAEIKMRLLSKAATDCQGIIPLVANLLTTLPGAAVADMRRATLPEHQRNYLQGAACEAFVHTLPKWAVGKPAGELYKVMARVDGLILLAVRDDDSIYIWRENVTISAHMLGVWISDHLDEVKSFCERSEPPPALPTPPPTPPASPLKRLARVLPVGGATDRVFKSPLGSPFRRKRRAAKSPSMPPAAGCATVREGRPFRLSSAASGEGDEEDQRMMLMPPRPGLLAAPPERAPGAAASLLSVPDPLPLTPPAPVASRCEPASSSRSRTPAAAPTHLASAPVVCGGPGTDPGGRRRVRMLVCGYPDHLDQFLDMVLLSEALSVVIFAPAQAAHGRGALRLAARGDNNRVSFIPGDPLDRDALKPLVLAPGLHSVVIFNEHLTRQPKAEALDVTVCRANVESLLPSTHHDVPVLTSLNSAADVKFADRSEWWPGTTDSLYGHVLSPLFASGGAIADEMLYPLMMGWCKYGLVEVIARLTDSVLDATEVKLIHMPQEFASTKRSTYGDLLPALMDSGYLPLALYRTRVDLSLKSTQYVHTNPPHATRLRPSDRVFVLARNVAQQHRNYNSSAARLDSAARTIQRALRLRTELRFSKNYDRANRAPALYYVATQMMANKRGGFMQRHRHREDTL